MSGLEKFAKIPDDVRMSTNVTNYAVMTRYPGEYDEITKKDYEESMVIAKSCLGWVESQMKISEER